MIAAFPERLTAADGASLTAGRLAADDETDTVLMGFVRAFTNAVEAYGRIDDKAAQARLWEDLGGIALRDGGQAKRASHSWKQALRLAEAAGDPSVHHPARRFLDEVGFEKG